MSDRPIPRATYRLQLSKDFRFADVARLAPYLGRLGISHAYLSPVLRARAGSRHGYDTVDHGIVFNAVLLNFPPLALALERELTEWERSHPARPPGES